MKKYNVYLNAGIEWETKIEAETLEEAKQRGYELAQDKIKEFHDYNFDCEVTEIKVD